MKKPVIVAVAAFTAINAALCLHMDHQREMADAPQAPVMVTYTRFEQTMSTVAPAVFETAAALTPTPEMWTDHDADLLAKMMWGEARGIESDTEKAATVWCVLNRVDYYGISIEDAVTAPHQFDGYDPTHPVDQDLKDLCVDVLNRWESESYWCTDVGRVLPADYLFFHGDGQHNHFRKDFKSTSYWDWSLESPYNS